MCRAIWCYWNVSSWAYNKLVTTHLQSIKPMHYWLFFVLSVNVTPTWGHKAQTMPIYSLCLLEYFRTAKKPLCKKTIRLESYFISVFIISLSLTKLVFVVVVFVLLDFRREKHDFTQPAVIIKSYLSPCSLLTNKFLYSKGFDFSVIETSD